jgi:hypothetical protein
MLKKTRFELMLSFNQPLLRIPHRRVTFHARFGFFFIGFPFKLSGLLRTMCDAAVPISEGKGNKRPLQDDYDNTESKKKCTESDRVKRRKFALLLAYSGQGYLGMQRLVSFYHNEIVMQLMDVIEL